jgi:hypothetical protein
MRWTLLLLAALLASGCTHNFLKENTLRSSSILSSLQTQQVLNNLAMLGCDPAANPCHLNLSAGLVQATDQGSATVLANVFSSGQASNNNLTPSLSAQRGLVEQWSVNPVVDGEQLETLRVAYWKALDPKNSRVDDAIIDQIVGLCVRFSLLPKEDTIKTILDHKNKDKKVLRVVLGICRALRKEMKELDERISLMHRYAEQLRKDKPREAFDVEMQILDLQQKKELREEQRALLLHLAGYKVANPKTVLPTASPASALGQGLSLAVSSLIDAQTPPRSVKMPSFSPRRPSQGTRPADSSDTTLLILTALQAKSPAGYLPSTDIMWESTRNPALVDQAEDQIGRLESLLFDEEFKSPWVWQGCKKDVPPCACYVGHFKGCKKECYVWVMPEQYETLREFTQIILSLAAPNVPTEFPAFSPVFSPGLR